MLSVPSAGKEQKRSRIFWSRDQHTPQTITTTAFPKDFNYIIIFIISLVFTADLYVSNLHILIDKTITGTVCWPRPWRFPATLMTYFRLELSRRDSL